MKKILALVLAISTILFSCDNGNNPNNEIQNTPEIDYCKICEGIQNQDHIHDYCLECDGVQTDPSHTCPVIEDPNQYTQKLGDGTYEIHSFMTDTTADSITGRVNEWLPKAETKIRGMLNELSPEFRSKYSEQLALIEDANAFKINLTSGFDFTINRINGACTPIFEEIIANIDTPLDRARFYYYYKALSNEAYKYGYSSYFDDNPNNTETQEKNYNLEKEAIIANWDIVHNNFGASKPILDIENDMNNGYTQITAQMKQLLTNNNVASDLNISENNLNQIINLSLCVSSLDSMHDYASSKRLSTHKSCATDGNTIDEAMYDKIMNLGVAIAPAKLNKSIFSQKLGRELC